MTCPCTNCNCSSIEALQQEIKDWADTVFPSRTAKQAMIKLVAEEIPEVLSTPTPEEYADVVILVLDAAALLGIDIGQAVRDKMAVNRSREWLIDQDTGLMHHV